eukprot:352598-Chlamydomonas_euryale.AAC.1
MPAAYPCQVCRQLALPCYLHVWLHVAPLLLPSPRQSRRSCLERSATSSIVWLPLMIRQGAAAVP